MADYFLSDVHLRLDAPDRGIRLAQLVDGLDASDTLTIVGDLCDFWFGSRQIVGDPLRCAGIRALAGFRDRGGQITAFAGNHDAWLGPFYERTIGARFVPDALEAEVQGHRVRVEHGHQLGNVAPWKRLMEGRAFLKAFRMLPDVVANRLGERLRQSNEVHQDEFDRRGLLRYRNHAAALRGRYDLVILGHVHQPLDTGAKSDPRLVVLGGWHEHSSYLKIANGRLDHIVVPTIVQADD